MEKNSLFNQLQTAAGRTIEAGGSSYLFFGGTAYLGLQQHPALMEYYAQGMQQYGLNNGTSRNNNVQLAVYPEAEAVAAKRFGAGAALIVSSGYLAAQMAVKQLAATHELLYAPATHPALWLNDNPGISGNFQAWVSATVDYINQSARNEFAVVSNTLNNLLPEQYDFSGFAAIHHNKKVHFLLDDSHGIGIIPYPENIRQLLPEHPQFSVTLVASMAKGLGTDAGLVLSDAATIATLKQSPIFFGASPPAPAAMYAFIRMEQLCRKEWETLHQNMQYFQQRLESACQYTPGLPVYYFPEAGLFERLLEQHIIISAFPYPTPAATLLNRVVISSVHTREDIDLLLSAIHHHV